MFFKFSPTYGAARRRFLEASQMVGGEVETITAAHAGPTGEKLAIDIAALGDPASTNVFVLCSGTHGV